jgi:hypothetical protein
MWNSFRICFALLSMIIIMHVYAEDNTCGNGICDFNENHYSCGIDCKSGLADNYCDMENDNKCDPDCVSTDPDCNGQIKTIQGNPVTLPYGRILAIASGILVAFIIAVIIRKIFQQKVEQDQKIYNAEEIEKFSNLKQTKEEGWGTKSDTEILNQIENDDKFKKYIQK